MLTMLVCPPAAARCIGCHPACAKSVNKVSAPYSQMAHAETLSLGWVLCQRTLLLVLGHAPYSKSKETHSAWPFHVARHRGVWPSCSTSNRAGHCSRRAAELI
eukprot:358287-Chlamydomonas_euryale.AAC.6